MRVLMFAAICLGLLAGQGHLHAAAQDDSALDRVEASRYVESVGRDAVAILSGEAVAKDRRQARMRGLLGEVFAVPSLCEYVLGSGWGSATATDQDAFCHAFEDYLLAYVGNVLEDEKPTAFRVTGTKDLDDGKVLVSTAVAREDEKPAQVDWVVRNGVEGFKVLDVETNKVSLMQTYRSEFISIAKREGIFGLTEALERKVTRY